MLVLEFLLNSVKMLTSLVCPSTSWINLQYAMLPVLPSLCVKVELLATQRAVKNLQLGRLDFGSKPLPNALNCFTVTKRVPRQTLRLACNKPSRDQQAKSGESGRVSNARFSVSAAEL